MRCSARGRGLPARQRATARARQVVQLHSLQCSERRSAGAHIICEVARGEAHMSVPTLMNMAPAPAMPPPEAFQAAFFSVSESGSFSFSAACQQQPARIRVRAAKRSGRSLDCAGVLCTYRGCHEELSLGIVHGLQAENHSLSTLEDCGSCLQCSCKYRRRYWLHQPAFLWGSSSLAQLH